MNKVFYGVLLALAVCGVAAIAYDEGKSKGYANGIRDSEKKPECECETCENQKLCKDLESEGEAIEPADESAKEETIKSVGDTVVSDNNS